MNILTYCDSCQKFGVYNNELKDSNVISCTCKSFNKQVDSPYFYNNFNKCFAKQENKYLIKHINHDPTYFSIDIQEYNFKDCTEEIRKEINNYRLIDNSADNEIINNEIVKHAQRLNSIIENHIDNVNIYSLKLDLTQTGSKRAEFYINGELTKTWKNKFKGIIRQMPTSNAVLFGKYSKFFANVMSYDPVINLFALIEYPAIEILLKAGYFGEYGISFNILPANKNYRNTTLNLDGKTPKDIFKIESNAGINLIKDLSNGKYELYWYSGFYECLMNIRRYGKTFDINLINKILKTCNDYSHTPDIRSFNYLSVNDCFHIYDLVQAENFDINKLFDYLYNEIRENQGITSPKDGFTLLKDYIKISKELEIEFEKYPKSLKLYHDRVAYLKVQVNNKDLEGQFKEKVKINSLLNYESTDFKIISPNDITDLKNEGFNLSHCVGTYVERYANESSRIYFLRKIDEPDKSFITLELNKDLCLVQAKGKLNRSLTTKEHKWVSEWLDKKVQPNFNTILKPAS